MDRITSEDRILAGFCHLMIMFGWIGTALALAIWTVRKDKSGFVKRNAAQAVSYQLVALTVLWLISLLFVPRISIFLKVPVYSFTGPALGTVLVIADLGFSLYGIFGAVAAFKGKEFKYALTGEFVGRIFK